MAAVVADGLKLVGRLVDALPDGVAVISRQGHILFANRQLEVLTGYSGSELLGLKVEDLVPEPQRTRHRQDRAAFAKHPVQRPMGADTSIELLRRDGTELPVDIALSPLADGSGSVVAAVRDARLRRAAEEAARQLALITERERVSRRLNDEVIQELFAIGLSLQALASQMIDDGWRRRLEDAVSATDRAIDSLRNVIFVSTDRLAVFESRLPNRHSMRFSPRSGRPPPRPTT